MAKKTEIVGIPEVPAQDLVNSPNHYADFDGREQGEGDVERCQAIRAMLGRAGYVAYLRASINSQNWRLGRKDDGTGGVQDVKKLIWYAVELQAVLEEPE